MPITVSHSIVDTVSRFFTEDQFNGFWYPSQPGEALVRVYMVKDSYQIERRRNLQSPWMPVVTAKNADFDPAAFLAWCSSWPLVAS